MLTVVPVCVCVCVYVYKFVYVRALSFVPFQLLNHLTDVQQTLYEY